MQKICLKLMNENRDKAKIFFDGKLELFFLSFLFSFFFYLSKLYQAIGPMSRMFTNGPGDRGSIPGGVIPKTQKMVLNATLLNTQHYKVGIKGKWSNTGNGLAPSPKPLCCNY